MLVTEYKKAGLFELPHVFEGIRLVRHGDPGFPFNLAQLPEFPEKLFYRGSLHGPDALAVSVVGSRRCSELGQKRAFRLSYELAQAGVTVVSGLAQGIDGAAHRGALAAGGGTGQKSQQQEQGEESGLGWKEPHLKGLRGRTPGSFG
ncbi:MAG: DNA-processing protein DprA [Vulcanimicrobiota bacterium]